MKRILDVGCGDGSRAVKKGINTEGYLGVDKDSDKVEVARGRGLEAEVMDATEELPDGEFDEVYIRDVLEHVRDPEAVMENTEEVLASDGEVTIQVPSELSENLWRDYTHLRAFTPKSIRDLANNTGFQVEEIKEKPTGDKLIIKKLVRRLTGLRLDVNEYEASLKKRTTGGN